LSFLVDKCVSATVEYPFHREFLRVIDQLGRGTKDPVIFEYVKDNNLTLVTRDIEFVFNLIKEGLPVIYIKKGSMPMLIESNVEQSIRFSDPVTYHLLESNEILIP